MYRLDGIKTRYMKHTRKPNTRDKLLDAAASIVIEQGAAGMTLDAASLPRFSGWLERI